MKSVLVTGADGFTGRHLAVRLRDAPTRVIGLGMSSSHAACVECDEFISADVRDPDSIAAVIRALRPDAIYHLAGLAAGSPADLVAVNVEGTRHVLQAARLHAADTPILVVGSAAEYGKVDPADLPITEAQPCAPVDAYGRSKHEATCLALAAARDGMRVVVARPFNIVGPGVPRGLVVGAFIDRVLRILDGGPRELRVGNIDSERDFVSVHDVVDAYVRLLEAEAWGEVVNLCSGRPRSIRSIVDHLIRLAGREIPVIQDPELFRPTDVPVSYGSWAKAARLIRFEPDTDFAAILAASWEHARRDRQHDIEHRPGTS